MAPSICLLSKFVFVKMCVLVATFNYRRGEMKVIQEDQNSLSDIHRTQKGSSSSLHLWDIFQGHVTLEFTGHAFLQKLVFPYNTTTTFYTHINFSKTLIDNRMSQNIYTSYLSFILILLRFYLSFFPPCFVATTARPFTTHKRSWDTYKKEQHNYKNGDNS